MEYFHIWYPKGDIFIAITTKFYQICQLFPDLGQFPNSLTFPGGVAILSQVKTSKSDNQFLFYNSTIF